jgi:hypothetical protein
MLTTDHTLGQLSFEINRQSELAMPATSQLVFAISQGNLLSAAGDAQLATQQYRPLMCKARARHFPPSL